MGKEAFMAAKRTPREQRQVDGLVQSPLTENDEYVVPIIAEELRVGKRVRRIGAVQVHKTVSQRVECVNVDLTTETAIVERIPVNVYVEEAPSITYEDDMIIVPVLEEVLVVEKKLLLKEKIKIRRQREHKQHTEHVTLRLEDVAIQREGDVPTNGAA
jgi:uncharacterized protein (TIGR02271 family)